MSWSMSARVAVLSDIVAELNELEVQFFDDDGKAVWKGSLIQALDNIANEIYWDEQSDWSEATSAEVFVI